MKRIVCTLMMIVGYSASVFAQFAPTNIDHIALWLRADSPLLSLNDRDLVSVWPDESGNGFDAAQSDTSLQPNFRLNQINGKPAILFSEEETHMTLGANYILSSLDGITIFAILSPRAGDDAVDTPFFYDVGDLTGPDRRGYGFVYNSDRIGVGTSESVGGLNRVGGNAFEHSFGREPVLFTGEILFRRVQRVSINTALQEQWSITELTALTETQVDVASSREDGAGPVTIGRQSKSGSQNSRAYIGYIAELIVYTNALEDEEIFLVENYLAEKYLPDLAQEAKPLAILWDYPQQGVNAGNVFVSARAFSDIFDPNVFEYTFEILINDVSYDIITNDTIADYRIPASNFTGTNDTLTLTASVPEFNLNFSETRTINLDDTLADVQENPVSWDKFAFYPGSSDVNATVAKLRIEDAGNTTLNVRIYSRDGRLKRFLLRDQSISGEEIITWNGSDEYGVLLPAGLYIAVIQVGNTTYRKPIRLIR